MRAGDGSHDFQGVFQQLFQFCTVDLSAFYFDVRKDALYCDAAASPRRRAARTVLDLIHHRLVTRLAPMLPFTMEEVWLERFPGQDSSVHLVDFPSTPATCSTPSSAAGRRRSAAPAASSPARWRSSGASSDRREPRGGAGRPRRRLGPARRAALGRLHRHLITSGLTLADAPAPAGAFALDDTPGVAVVSRLADGAKCARCWKILPDVGTHAHPGVCSRCDAALI